ncbi:MAG: exodeoxyribonuclease VII large subunit [Gemmatimonadaceae bacterium]|nr:exodeoxyribonuclease VII large subunit [Gemmatimonadaceae bacterium]
MSAGGDPGASPDDAIGVGQIAHAAKDIIEGAFPRIWVRGEVMGLKQYASGHWYFTLKDAEGALSAVVWNAKAKRRTIPAVPDEGTEVAALGRLTVYPAKGSLQFSVEAMEAAGEGLWRKQFEEARRRLEADGLLDPSRKRPIPRLPRTVAVITSAQGAAVRDVIAVVGRRAPAVQLVLVDAQVQGDAAPASLVAALDRVARWGGADTVIIGRGGGSKDDLWAFNDEAVARAVAACPVPIISAVGHETDISLTDLVADLRAPTPSAAAEAAVPVWAELQAEVQAQARRLRQSLVQKAARARQKYDAVQRQLQLASTRLVERRRARLEGIAGRLEALSPLATLARGYGVARATDGTPLTRAIAFKKGLSFELVLQDGRVRATASEVIASPAPDAP